MKVPKSPILLKIGPGGLQLSRINVEYLFFENSAVFGGKFEFQNWTPEIWPKSAKTWNPDFSAQCMPTHGLDMVPGTPQDPLPADQKNFEFFSKLREKWPKASDFGPFLKRL